MRLKNTTGFTLRRVCSRGASSVAGLLITTEAMVAELPRKKDPMLEMPPGGGMNF
jgi:chaperonin GroEL